MILKLHMKHQAIEFYKVCINYDPWMTLAYVTASSSLVAHAFEWGDLDLFHGKVNLDRPCI